MDVGGGSPWAHLTLYTDGEGAAFQINSFNQGAISVSN